MVGVVLVKDDIFRKLEPMYTGLNKNDGKEVNHYWASEASPTLGCSIEISRDIYCRYVSYVINCVGGIV